MHMKYDVAKTANVTEGVKRIEWADAQMGVLQEMRKEFTKTKPFKGVRMAACLHVTTETANLMRTLKAGGASVILCPSNPLSTQDDTAAALAKKYDIATVAIHGESRTQYYKHLNMALDTRPHITMDDGADLVSLLHTKRKKQAEEIWGSTEETTTGVIRLKSLEKAGKLLFPVVAVNDSDTKHLFDNRYGTGQSTIDGVIRATNVLIAGKIVVIVGYGWCGRGAAMRARGLGARVVVTEVDPVKAIEAVMDGFDVMPMSRAAVQGDIFITLTGDIHVIRKEHMRKMKDGAIVCNSGHFDIEIDLLALEKMSKSKKEVRPTAVAYTLRNGRRIIVLAEGRLVNLASAEGHPASVMDMSFANQSHAALFIAKKHRTLENKVYVLPEATDQKIARTKLRTLGMSIDALTPEQRKYLASWEMGT